MPLTPSQTGTPCPDKKSSCTSGVKKATTLPGCGNKPGPAGTTLCTIDFTPSANASAPYYTVPVSCGGTKADLRLLPGETEVEIRILSDITFIEVRPPPAPLPARTSLAPRHTLPRAASP